MEISSNSHAIRKKGARNNVVYSFKHFCCYLSVSGFFTLTSSLKNNTEIFTEPFSLPRTPQWENYVRAWTIGKMGVYFKNSIILTAATLFVSAIIGSMASYILAKYTFKGKSFVYILFLAGMMIPIQTVIIPLALHLENWESSIIFQYWYCYIQPFVFL